MLHVLRDVFGLDAGLVWHAKGLPAGAGAPDAVVLPGGFSYGDRLRAGAIAARSPVMADVRRMAAAGAPVLGVCNGFQVLAEAGMLPGALLRNDPPRFRCGWTEIIAENCSTPFTSMYRPGARVPVQSANGEGRYYADGETLERLRRNGQVAFRYAGGAALNGSSGGIAGVCSEEGNVLGMMPHPERAAEPGVNPLGCGPASLLFRSLAAACGGAAAA